MRIEEIKPSQRKRGRFLVKLEDGTILRLTEAEVAAFGLRAGLDLDSGRLAQLQADLRRSAARAQAAGIAGSRALSRRHYGARGYGPGRVREELRRRGVPKEFWEDALAQLPEAGASIDAYLQKKCRSAAPDAQERRRLADGLLRRGFSWEDIRPALDRLGGDEEE